jgi:superfamily II DNA or RNA helicase
MGFNDLEIKTKYKSLTQDLLEDFYLPVLSRSINYDRAVGYFSSESLLLMIQGIRNLVRNQGHIRLIISPTLTDEDYHSLTANNKLKTNVIESMFESFLKDDKTLIGAQILVVLMEKNYLNIKVAIPNNNIGIFHEKIGIFTDNSGDRIAISGSNNETRNALKLNHESFNTFCSWKLNQDEYVIEHENDFESYWSNRDSEMTLVPIESAVSENYFKKFETNKSIEELYRSLLKEESFEYQLPFSLYPHQSVGATKWLEKREGILKYATGSGKTKTAIFIIDQVQKERKVLFTIIVVPDKTLVNQWFDEVTKYKWSAIKCFSDNYNWPKQFKDARVLSTVADRFNTCIIVTNDTFNTGRFNKELNHLGSDFLLVVDECHTWGTERTLSNLPIVSQKLGLSATPELFFSEDKTKRLLEYFGGIIDEYSLEQAISDKRLVPYKYIPIKVKLNQEEKERYKEITLKIVKMIGRDIEHFNDKYDKALEFLLFQRARIVYGAKSKLSYLEENIDGIKEGGNLLIYCGPTSYKDSSNEEIEEVSTTQLEEVNKILAKKGLKFAQYTSQENERERIAALDSFKKQSYSTLVAIKCLDEGVDIPQIQKAVILASSTNPREFIQRRGRILRVSPNKDFAVIYDFIVFEEELESLIKKEIDRVYEFGRIAMNKDEVFKEYSHLFEQYREENV